MDRKEAIEIVQKNYPHVGTSGSEFETALRELVPELKESDDERIRKAIGAAICGTTAISILEANGTNLPDALSYLERQKELIPYTDFVIKPHKGDDNYPYDMRVSDAQEYAIKRGFGIPFNDGEVYVDERHMIQTIGNIIRWADEHPKEQKPADDKAFEEWIDDWWKHNKVNNPDSYDKCDEIQFDERGFKNFCRGIRNMYQQQPAEWSEDYRGEDLRTRFAFYTYKDEDDALYLSNVFVEETSRNKGFGTKILAAAEKVAETIGAINIRLKVKQNSPANAWYRKHGYGYMAFEGDYDWLEKTLEYLKPINPEWSEEDEEIREEVIGDLCALKDWIIKYDANWLANPVLKNIDKRISWLKSLRPQPKEDLNAIAQREYARGKQDGYWEGVKAERESCKTFHYESPNWPPKMPDLPTETTTNEGVSSIQPHWKPSEEQIDALEYFIRSWGESGTMSPQNTILCAANSLLIDLQKLL